MKEIIVAIFIIIFMVIPTFFAILDNVIVFNDITESNSIQINSMRWYVAGFIVSTLVSIYYIRTGRKLIEQAKIDNLTYMHGEECYGKITNIGKVDAFGYRLIRILVYSPLLKKNLVFYEKYHTEEEHPFPNFTVSYVKLKHLEGDVNIEECVKKEEIPLEILKKLDNQNSIFEPENAEEQERGEIQKENEQ